MIREDSSFALEKLVPGTFALQGVLGGVLGGLVWVWALILWDKEAKLAEMVSIIPLAMFVGAILGAIVATSIWMMHSVADLRMRAGTRVALMINTVGAIAIVLSRTAELTSDRNFPGWVIVALVSALPTALLVGSRVKPWELFTFGSIAAFRNDVQTRVGSNSVGATLAILPLRFLSIIVLTGWILKFSCERKLDADLVSAALMFITPLVYPALSAYVTFSSPRKLTVLTIAVAVNLPYGLISTVAFANSSNTSWLNQLPDNPNFICMAFTLAWALFLIARISVQTGEPIIPTSALSKLVMRRVRLPQP